MSQLRSQVGPIGAGPQSSIIRSVVAVMPSCPSCSAGAIIRSVWRRFRMPGGVHDGDGGANGRRGTHAQPRPQAALRAARRRPWINGAPCRALYFIWSRCAKDRGLTVPRVVHYFLEQVRRGRWINGIIVCRALLSQHLEKSLLEECGLTAHLAFIIVPCGAS